MSAVHIPNIYDDLLLYLEEIATPEEILAFRASAESEERAEELLFKKSAGTLTLDEFVELEQMLYVDTQISLLKARALEKITAGLGSKPTGRG